MATVANELKARQKPKEDVGQIPQWKLMVRRFMRSRLSVGGGIVLIFFYTLALFGDFVAPNKFDLLDSNHVWAEPSQIVWGPNGPGMYGVKQELDQERFQWVYTTDTSVIHPIRFFVQGYEWRFLGIIPSNMHLFGVEAPPDQDIKLYPWGADKEGRCVFSRTIIGSQISLSIGIIGVLLTIVLGSLIGTASGYFGGAIDNLMQRIIELIQSFPTLPLWMALAAALPTDVPIIQRFMLITLVLAFVNWTGLSREVRGKVLAFRAADYTNAALAAGASHWHIITRHMVPNAMSHIVVVAALAIPGTIQGESALSFLGLGILPPAISWGVLIRDAQNIQAVLTYPWMLLPVGVLIIAVLAFNLLGDGIRDAVDPYA